MQIRWTESAVDDLIGICDYIEQHGSAASARRVAISIHSSLDLLAHFPEGGRTGRKPVTRELVFHNLPYLAVYRVIPTESRLCESYTAHNRGLSRS